MHGLVGRKTAVYNVATKSIQLAGRLSHIPFEQTSGTRSNPGFYIDGVQILIKGTLWVNERMAGIAYDFAYASQINQQSRGVMAQLK